MAARTRFSFATAAVATLATASTALAQSAAPAPVAPPSHDTPIVVHAAEITWSPGPASLPPGAEFAVLEGNPSQPEPLTLRLRFPANYVVPPHYHSVLEHVTIFSGTLYVGMGETIDRSAGTALGPGDFGVIPVEMIHHAWTGSEPVVFQLHSVGPWSITYANPKDDPRTAAK